MLCGDFEIPEEEPVETLQEYLNSCGPDSSASGSPPSRSTQQAHVNPTGSVARETRGRGSALTQYGPVNTQSLGSSPSPAEKKPRKYLELCVNHRKNEKRLGEIDLTDVTTDEDLFCNIAETYASIRGSLGKALFLLEPVDIHFVHVSPRSQS